MTDDLKECLNHIQAFALVNLLDNPEMYRVITVEYNLLHKALEEIDILKLVVRCFLSDIREVLNPNYRPGDNIVGDELKRNLGIYRLKELLDMFN